jgi:hypothetical protein
VSTFTRIVKSQAKIVTFLVAVLIMQLVAIAALAEVEVFFHSGEGNKSVS